MEEQHHKDILQLRGMKALLLFFALFGFFTCIGLYLIVEQIVFIFNIMRCHIPTLAELFESCFSLIIGIFLIRLEWSWFSSALAKYEPLSDGLKVKYPFRSSVIYHWDDFQQVCVCYSNYTTKGKPKANPVICFVKKGEKTNIYGRWKTDNPFKYRTVICIDYSPELHEGIKNRCPYEVVDLRNTYAYRLWSDYHRF